MCVSGYQLGELKDEVNRFWNLQKIWERGTWKERSGTMSYVNITKILSIFISLYCSLEQYEGENDCIIFASRNAAPLWILS